MKNSAFVIAVSLLREGKLVRPDRNYVDDELIDSFVRMLSPIIPDVLPQILDAYGDYPSKGDAPAGYVSVLRQTFAYALMNFPDDKLGTLNDPTFVAENLGELIDISPRHNTQIVFRRSTDLLALQILQDIQVLQNVTIPQDVEERKLLSEARSRLGDLINPEGSDSKSITLSSSLLHEIRRLYIIKDPLIEAAFSIIKQSGKIADSFRIFRPDKDDPFLHQFFAAASYVTSASTVNRKSETIAIPVVESFLDVLKSGSVADRSYAVERTAVCVLVRSMSSVGPGHGRSERAEELLRLLSQFPKERLLDGGVHFLHQWGDLDVELRAMESCGLRIPRAG